MDNIIDINRRKSRPTRQLPACDAGGTRTFPITEAELSPNVKAIFEHRNDDTNGKLDRIWFSWPTLEDATTALGKYVTSVFPMPDGESTLLEATVRRAVAAYDATLRENGEDIAAMTAYIGALLDAATVLVDTAVHVGNGKETKLWTPFRVPIADFARANRADTLYFRNTVNYEFMKKQSRGLLAVQLVTAGELALLKQHGVVE